MKAPAATAAWSAVRAIALNTFREAIRDRILYLLLVFALLLIGASRLLSMLTVGSEDKIIKDLGLSAISVFGVLTAVFVGVSIVFKEIEKRTVFTLLACPVRRWHFIAGKYAGLLSVLGLIVGVMSGALCLLLAVRGEPFLPLLPAILLIFFELAMVTAFAILFSTLTNPMLAALWTFVAYVVGHLTWSLELLQARMPEGPGRFLCDLLYTVLPNLEWLNVRGEAVRGALPATEHLIGASAYGVCYALAVLVVACMVFERKEFI